MSEVICDFRFAICDLGAPGGRNARSSHNCGEFACLLLDLRFAVVHSNRKSQI
jgi:hypothetical protein